MRAPGILGWDREEELTDWRDQLHKSTASGSVTSSSGSSQHSAEGGGKSRRKSREEHRACRSRDKNHTRSTAEESRSIERLECDNGNGDEGDNSGKFMTSLCKSFSTSSASTWLKDDFRYLGKH